MKLKSIIPRGIFSLATKEKAWQFFQGIHAELTESVKAMVGDQQLAACVKMFAAEEPIRFNSGRSSDSFVSPNPLCTTLSSDERYIYAYVESFVLFWYKRNSVLFLHFPSLLILSAQQSLFY